MVQSPSHEQQQSFRALYLKRNTMTRSSNPTAGCFRGYSSEQKTLRAKLDHLIKWTRDLKTNLMKQSWKVLQTNSTINETIYRQLIDQIHDDLDHYKRKCDREVGRIHDICDTLTNPLKSTNDSENLRNEILEALRRSPTYSSLEQHIDGEQGPRIRVRPRERIHPGREQQTVRTALSTDTIKRKATQPIALKVLDTSVMPGAKRRSQVDAFKRSRCFTNVEHTETTLGMDYVEEDENDLSWKPFGPKKPATPVEHQPSPESTTTSSAVEPPKSSPVEENNSSDEEFDVAWERRAKLKARKEVASAPAPPIEAPTTAAPTNPIDLDLDETAQDGLPAAKSDDKPQTEVVELDDDDDELTTTSTRQVNNQDDDSLIIEDSDDEIITLSDDEKPKKSSISRVKSTWTSSQIQITSDASQSQSMHNPYRVGIADPSIRSVFLPPPSSNSQTTSISQSSQRRTQGGNRKTASNKRGTHGK